MFGKDREKDERAIAVEGASYTLAYKVVSFALLVDVMARALLLKSGTWDLLGIVILGGIVATAYQIKLKTATRGWIKIILLSTLAAVVVALLVALFMK